MEEHWREVFTIGAAWMKETDAENRLEAVPAPQNTSDKDHSNPHNLFWVLARAVVPYSMQERSSGGLAMAPPRSEATPPPFSPERPPTVHHTVDG
jgi:hypothetical protein